MSKYYQERLAKQRVLDRILGTEVVAVDEDNNEMTEKIRIHRDAKQYNIVRCIKEGTIIGVRRSSDGLIIKFATPMKMRVGDTINFIIEEGR